MKMKKYYAQQSPRGFGNEVNTYVFDSKKARDQWVAQTAGQDVRTSRIAVTREEAFRTIRYQGDAITQSFNSALLDPGTGEPVDA